MARSASMPGDSRRAEPASHLSDPSICLSSPAWESSTTFPTWKGWRRSPGLRRGLEQNWEESGCINEGTPIPLANIIPRLFCAAALPYDAAIRYSSSALESSRATPCATTDSRSAIFLLLRTSKPRVYTDRRRVALGGGSRARSVQSRDGGVLYSSRWACYQLPGGRSEGFE